MPSVGPLFHRRVSRCGAFELVTIFIFLVHLVQSYDCGIKPLIWPIQNGTFNDVQGVNRGITLQLPGNQLLGLRPTTCHNVTWIRDSRDCTGNATQIVICEGASGSIFDPTDPGFVRQPNSIFDSNIPFVDADPVNAKFIKGEALGQFDGGPNNISIPLVVW